MLTDLLLTVSDQADILLHEENYLLARIQTDNRSMLAEVSEGNSGGIHFNEWPKDGSILLPDSEIDTADEQGARILLFTPPDDAKLYLELLKEGREFSEKESLTAGKRMLTVLRRLHDAGTRVGYLGPENVLVCSDGSQMILGGARGIPDTPFSPPEAVGRTADDPRSDVYAIGLLMFRLVAGSDERKKQIDTWNRLDSDYRDLLEKMVTPEPDKRFPNLTVLSEAMDSVEPAEKADSTANEEKCRRRNENKAGKPYLKLVIPVSVAILVALFLIFGKGKNGDEHLEAPPDTSVHVHDEIPEDTLPAADQQEVLPAEIEPVIWVSNGTGQAGLATEFRQGSASEYSSVYACTGSPRSSSILLARRLDPRQPLQQQDRLLSIVGELTREDTSIAVRPVDVTILIGNDLIDDTAAQGILKSPSAPEETLYVDVANHGVQGTYGGAGAATWVRSVINGRSLDIGGEEWLIEVVDFRDGDMLNPELGIPGTLDSTVFMYRDSLSVLVGVEEAMRRTFLENAPEPAETSALPDPPDIWVLLGG
ncbi:MAG: hypothetical protein GF388_11545 [Candidatus Aegiribacteria sp.]|nr:hypothetical protein [Candidatus Aegiribacteria sp.]MBD3295619.1 hypothetical protein [Candidatus Fermentibacteria bacterium]